MSSGGQGVVPPCGDAPSHTVRVVVLGAMLAMAAVSAYQVLQDIDGAKQARGRKRVRDAFQWDDFLDELTPLECQRLFRMSRVSIDILHERIGHRLETGRPDMGERGCGHSISTMQRLLVALAYFAGAIPPYVEQTFKPISHAEVFISVKLVIQAINVEFKGRWEFPTLSANPTEEEYARVMAELDRLSKGFENSGRQCPGWVGQVGALDGCDILQKNPGGRFGAKYYVKRKAA